MLYSFSIVSSRILQDSFVLGTPCARPAGAASPLPPGMPAAGAKVFRKPMTP